MIPHQRLHDGDPDKIMARSRLSIPRIAPPIPGRLKAAIAKPQCRASLQIDVSRDPNSVITAQCSLCAIHPSLIGTLIAAPHHSRAALSLRDSTGYIRGELLRHVGNFFAAMGAATTHESAASLALHIRCGAVSEKDPPEEYKTSVAES